MQTTSLQLEEIIQIHNNPVSSLIFLTREHSQTKRNVLPNSYIVSMVEVFFTLSTHFLTKLSRIEHGY